MSSALAALIAAVWLSLVALAALVVVQKSPKRRKPVDELEAADAALRLRLIDLEDKFETYCKREAVRLMRARREPEQQELPIDRKERLSALYKRARERGLIRGVV